MNTTLPRFLIRVALLGLCAASATAQGIGNKDAEHEDGRRDDGIDSVPIPPDADPPDDGGGALPPGLTFPGRPGATGGRGSQGAAPGACPPVAAPGQGAAPAGPMPSARPRASGVSEPIEWWDWWAYNRERFLHVDPSGGRGPRTFAGVGEKERAGSILRLRSELVPALLDVLDSREEEDVRVLRAALASIGRAGPPADAGQDARAVEALSTHVAHPHASVAEAAVIALGAYGTPSAVLALGELCEDGDAGRAIAARGRVPVRLRALSAYGLGVAASGEAAPELRRYAVHALARLLASDVARYPDIQAAAVIALGLTPAPGQASDGELPPAAGLAPQVGYLLELLRDERRPRMARIHAPTAIARLLASGALAEHAPALREEALDTLLDALDRGEEVAVRRSAVVALGELADADMDDVDRDVRRALIGHLRSGDLASRRFAAIALARIAARPGPAGDSGQELAGLDEVRAALVRGVSRGKQAERAWSALALGVLGHDLRAIGERLPVEVPDLLIAELRGERNASEAAAYALALGLVGDGRAVDEVVEALDRVSHEGFRGLIAVGLGLIRQGAGLEPLVTLTAESLHRPVWMETSGLARALIGDSDLVTDLAAAVDECDCTTSVTGTSRALARTADARAAKPLLALAFDAGRPASVRARAIRALGWLARRDGLPWDARVSIGLNYIDGPSSLTDPTGHGVLDTY